MTRPTVPEAGPQPVEGSPKCWCGHVRSSHIDSVFFFCKHLGCGCREYDDPHDLTGTEPIDLVEWNEAWSR